MSEEFVNLKYKPSKEDLICLFRVEPKVKMKTAVNDLALESSVGTWDKVKGLNERIIKRLGAKAFSINKNSVKIAYPIGLFELGNMPSILSGIAGNIFGMKSIRNLRLEDIEFPKELLHSFKGPKYGIMGIRKMIQVYDRPLVGTIVKPKVGLNAGGHANYAYKSWTGGLDLVKSDENLTDQKFNRFKERVKKTIKMMERAEKDTGEKKIYVENVTAETKEMIKRARFIQDNGGNCAMIDVIVAGWSAFQSLRNEDLDLMIHVHRAGHGMFTENPKQGMSMLSIAKIVRLIGGDDLHIGAIFGKMKGKEEEIKTIEEEIEMKFVRNKNILNQDWNNIKPIFAVCSGGIHAGVLPKLVRTMGKDIICQAGGGVSAHPLGIKAGASSMRQAIDSITEGVPIQEYAKNHKELRIAIERWGYLR